MKVIIAEKPKAASKIAYALKAKPKRKGKVTIFEGEKLIIVPSVGHIFTLAEKNQSFDYPVFDIEWKPVFEVNKTSYFAKPYFAVIKNILKEAEELIVATDFDTEGTLIGYNIFRFLSEFSENEVKRMKFSTLTSKELQQAYENLIDFDKGNAYAGELRHKLDWIYGINLSRALMKSLATQNIRRVMSIGRVQGPTLALVAKKEKEIEEFVPKPYFELWIKIKNTNFEYEKNPIEEEEEALKLKDKVGKEAKVIEYSKEIKKVPPFPPFDLTSLQVEAAKYLRFSPSKTLKIAQSLYESGYISYPRTSSQKLPPSIGYKRIIEKLAKYYKEAEKLLEKPYLKPIEGKKDDPAHPAIYPTGNMGKMEEEEKKLFELIVRRFISVFYDFMEKEEIRAKVESNDLLFKAKGQKIKSKGWLEVYNYYKFEEKEIDEFKEGELEKISKVELKKKKTKPPKRYTSSSLITELERKSLGTKATRSHIIDTLFRRQYFEGGSIKLTEFGGAVYRTLKKYVPKILDEKLTREIEEDMEKVSNLKLNANVVFEKGKKTLEEILKEFKENEEKIGEELLKNLPKKRFYYGKKKKK